MRFTKVLIFSVALAQLVSGTALAQVSDTMKSAMKFVCAGKPAMANDSLCKQYCADKENAIDAVCTAGKKDEKASLAAAKAKLNEEAAIKKQAQADAAAAQAKIDAEAAAKAQALKTAALAAAAQEAADAKAEAKAEAAAQKAAAADDDEKGDDKPEVIATPMQSGPVLMPIAPKANPQRAEGMTADGLKWKVHFNFPICDHSDQGKPKGAYCEGTDSSASEKANGVEEQLISWIKDPETKGLYLSYFSFSNKNIAAALCVETSLRPDLKVTLFLVTLAEKWASGF